MAAHRVSGKWVVLAIVALPVLAIALIYWWVDVGNREGPRMVAPRIGAGAGDAGGANAIGQWREEHARAETAESPQLISPESLPRGFILQVEDVTRSAHADSPVFLAATFNDWNPADPLNVLHQDGDGLWSIHLRLPGGGKPMEFKFTRGSWEQDERDRAGKAVPNRTLAKLDVSALRPDEVPTVRLRIEGWGEPPPEPSVSGDLRRIEIPGPAGGDSRTLLVWLPPGYDEAADHEYPVLYMLDGQNMFEAHAGIPAEWGIDETATALIGSREIRPLIVVGIPSHGQTRRDEYMPPRRAPGSAPIADRSPTGDTTLEWIMGMVLPTVERQFRVQTGPQNTGIGGASLGGLMALYCACQAPDVFGRALVESPTLSLGTPAHWKWSDSMSLQRLSAKVWLGIGGREASPDEASDDAKQEANQAYMIAGRELSFAISEEGAQAYMAVVVPARHNESAWAERLPRALKYLFPPDIDGTK